MVFVISLAILSSMKYSSAKSAKQKSKNSFSDLKINRTTKITEVSDAVTISIQMKIIESSIILRFGFKINYGK